LRSPRKRDEAPDPAPAGRLDHVGEFVAEGARIEEHGRRAGKPLCRRGHHLHTGGKRGVIRIAGDRADPCARSGEFSDQRAADVAGGARDENCVHAIKDDAAAEKVTRRLR
jgi:hypothetical protein